jgi:hypothetical protein
MEEVVVEVEHCVASVEEVARVGNDWNQDVGRRGLTS